MKKNVILLVMFIIICSGIYYFGLIKNKDKGVNNEKKEVKEIYTYFEHGVTISEANLYNKNNDEYVKIGTINKDLSLKFVNLIDNYLLIDGFDSEYYIDINDVKNVDDELLENSNETRYKTYILFNENIITKDSTSFYDEENNLLYTIDKSFEFPIIMKNDNSYGIEFNNRMLFITKDDVSKIVESNNTDKKSTYGVGVLNYHFFYDDNNEEEVRECNQIICKSITDFQNELDYLKNNNIITITMKELELFIDGKINLPKSVLITIDDGYLMTHGIQLLEKNQMYGTVFLITSWFDEINFLDEFKYVEFHSHGDDLHDVGVCSGGQGGAIKCLEKDTLLNDLELSSKKLGGSKYFAYPFYEYNSYSIEVLKKAGYSLAFAGYGTTYDSLVHVGNNKYEIPRYVMYDYTKISNLENYLKNIR